MTSSSWVIGQRIEDHKQLALSSDAPAGAKELMIGVYDGGSDDLERLRIVNDGGRVLPEDFVILGRIRVSR
jgi:hypothetical protein